MTVTAAHTSDTISASSDMIGLDELRSLFLFEALSDEQLLWLQANGEVRSYTPGVVYREGEPATCFYIMLDGELTLSRMVGGEDVEVTRTDHRGVYSGAMQAYMGGRVPQLYTSSLNVTEPSRFFVMDAERFAEFMKLWFPMALHLLEGLFFGIRNVNGATEQRERLLALGSLSAGLTHELNNPAAAAVRATSLLRDRVAGMRHKLRMIAEGSFDRDTLAVLIKLQEEATDRVAFAPQLSAMEASDREDEIADWLDDHGCTTSWELAPVYVQGGLEVGWLEQVAELLPQEALEGAFRWLMYTIETELLLDEIQDSTTRVSTLVGAAKQYSQMDRAPYQTLDVHELLDSTLIMMSGKLGDIEVVKDYDHSLPDIPVYGAELNQVWTNMIDNAIGAMKSPASPGTLTLRTSRVGDYARIEIGDTGTGIPAEVQSRIFEPFFTTKPVGEGTGLGLDISWRIVVKRHHGNLSVQSEPGDTRFMVSLPIHPDAPADLVDNAVDASTDQAGSDTAGSDSSGSDTAGSEGGERTV